MARTTTDEIEAHLERKRAELRSNLEELEQRVKSVTDWRRQFRKNPAISLLLAFGGGFLIASLTGRSRPRYEPRHDYAPERRVGVEGRRSAQVWNGIQSALIGVAAAARLAETLAAVGSRLKSHFADAERADGVQGEGDYGAARRYRSAAEQFAHTADVSRAARNAAPGDEAEDREIADAEARGQARSKYS
jgi:hypothetical protein